MRFGISGLHYYPVLGLAYLCAGDVAAARACAQELQAGLEDLRFGYYIPQVYLWACAQLFHFLEQRDEAAAFARASYERYAEMLATLNDGPMRDAFVAYRFNRAIVALHEHGTWAPDPMRSWFQSWDVGDVRANDDPRAVRTARNEKRQAGAHR